jgi:hypothetical protein
MQGRLVGLVYLGVVSTGIFTLACAPGKPIVEGDARRFSGGSGSRR